MATVDEDEELDALGSAVVEECVERGTDGAAGVEDVIHQDDVAAFDVEADLTLLDDRTDVTRREVVTIEADVEHAHVDGLALDGLDELADTLRERNAAALNADEADVGRAIVALDDLMRETDEGALDLRRGHEAALLAEAGRACGFGVR